MLKTSFIPNHLLIRTLKSAISPAVQNKPPKTKWANDYINYPFIFSFDRPHHYMDLNSRLITVEGNIGVGKEKIAKKVANYFSMQFVGDVKEEDLHVYPLNDRVQLDARLYNKVLPRTSKTYTREMFWNDDDPIKYGKPLLLQLHHYYWRFWYVCRAMAHLLNNGQGIVMERSPWSDNVMALAMKECNLLSEPAYKYYNLMRCESIPSLWRPNIIIYVKASPEVIRQKLKEKNGWESKACNITDKFIETYTNILENKYLVDSASFSKIFTIDLTEYDIDDEDDFSGLMESMAKLNNDFKEIDEFDTMFLDWRNGTHCRDALDLSRSFFSSALNCFSKSFRQYKIPYALHEGAYSEDELAHIHMILDRDERITKDALFDSKYEKWRNIMFAGPQFNYANPDHSPLKFMAQSWA